MREYELANLLGNHAISNRLRAAVASMLVVAGLVSGPAAADQTDVRLDELFEELRTGGAINAKANADRILEIWSDSQSDTVDVLYERALTLYHDADHIGALKILAYVRKLSPNFMQAYALSGFVRLSIDDNAAALDDFSNALRLEPRQFEVRKALSQLLLSSGEDRAAYEMLQKGLEWNPYDEDMRALAKKLRTQFEGQEI